QFAEAGIPFIFDPGQGMPMFDGEDLRRFVEQATYVTLNDYEAQLMSERTGWSHDELARHVKALIITRGGDGSTIYTDGQQIQVPSAPIQGIKDPTGCGDAYRAGLLWGLLNGLDWETTGRIASLMGAIKIEHLGPQNHAPSRADIEARFKEAFGREM
ncbi:MAG: PfkB family carbohydrate kinase, partial [Ectothiorhodospira sp.]